MNLQQLRHAFPVSAASAAALLAALPARAAENTLVIFPTWETLPTFLMRVALLLALFTVLVVVLDRLVFTPLLGVLRERQQQTEGSRARAAELAREAEALLARYRDAVGEARERAGAERRAHVEEARRAHQQRVAEARTAGEQQIARARHQVSSAFASAREQLGRDATELAREVAERLLGRRVA
jgi:F-type H+-transporting ATPase subunit b